MNTVTHQHVRTPTRQHISTSAHQHFNTNRTKIPIFVDDEGKTHI